MKYFLMTIIERLQLKYRIVGKKKHGVFDPYSAAFCANARTKREEA